MGIAAVPAPPTFFGALNPCDWRIDHALEMWRSAAVTSVSTVKLFTKRYLKACYQSSLALTREGNCPKRSDE